MAIGWHKLTPTLNLELRETSPKIVRNQDILEKWCKNDNVFLLSEPHVQGQVFKVTITGGESLIMPTGMIHMVRTREDSMAVGFNFFTMCEQSNYT